MSGEVGPGVHGLNPGTSPRIISPGPISGTGSTLGDPSPDENVVEGGPGTLPGGGSAPGPISPVRDAATPDRSSHTASVTRATRSIRANEGVASGDRSAVAVDGPGAPPIGRTPRAGTRPRKSLRDQAVGFSNRGDPLTSDTAGAAKGRVAGLGGAVPRPNAAQRHRLAVLLRPQPRTPASSHSSPVASAGTASHRFSAGARPYPTRTGPHSSPSDAPPGPCGGRGSVRPLGATE
jgi:hypothetical protein